MAQIFTNYLSSRRTAIATVIVLSAARRGLLQKTGEKQTIW